MTYSQVVKRINRGPPILPRNKTEYLQVSNPLNLGHFLLKKTCLSFLPSDTQKQQVRSFVLGWDGVRRWGERRRAGTQPLIFPIMSSQVLSTTLATKDEKGGESRRPSNATKLNSKRIEDLLTSSQLKWLDELPDELDVLIAHRDFEVAVTMGEKCKKFVPLNLILYANPPFCCSIGPLFS